jgi:hypothetical protein
LGSNSEISAFFLKGRLLEMAVDDATYATCAWTDKMRPFESPRHVVGSVESISTSLVFTYSTLTALMAVFCDHLPLKNARTSYPISL